MKHMTRRQAVFLSLSVMAFISSITIVSYQLYRLSHLKREYVEANREYARYYKRYMELSEKKVTSARSGQDKK